MYLKSANNWALADLSTQADLCVITLGKTIFFPEVIFGVKNHTPKFEAAW